MVHVQLLAVKRLSQTCPITPQVERKNVIEKVFASDCGTPEETECAWR